MPRRIVGMIAFGLAVTLAGCAQQNEEGLIAEIEGAQVTSSELQIRVSDYIWKFMSEIEAVANGIILETDSSTQRIRAVTLMVRANEELIGAYMQDDPVLSLLDAWAFAAQLRYFFESGDGQDMFGPPFQQRVIDVCARMEARADALASYAAPERDRAVQREMYEKIVERPITRDRMYRPSIIDLMVEYEAKQTGDVFTSVQNLETRIQDVAQQLDILTVQLPKQIIWHADILVEDRLRQLGGPEIGEKVDRALDIVEETRDDVDRQRVDTLERVDAMRAETLSSVDAKVDVLFDRLDETIAISLDSVDEQRRMTMDRIDTVVDVLVQTIDQSEADIAARLETARLDTIDEVTATVTRVVDVVFVRVLILLAVGAVLGVLGILLWRKTAPAPA